MDLDSAYYRRRLAEELAAARRADCARAAGAHRELAEIYRILIDAGEPGREPKVIYLMPEAILPGQ